MLDCFRGIAFFLQGDSQRGMAACVRRAKQQCTPANLDGVVEFAFFEQGIAEAIKSKKVIGV